MALTGNTYTDGPSSGQAALISGTVTVSTAEVKTGDVILLTRQISSGTPGHLTIGTITDGTSFVINSSSGTDGSQVFWQIVH